MNPSFKMYGGLQYSSNKNIVKSNIGTTQNKVVYLLDHLQEQIFMVQLDILVQLP